MFLMLYSISWPKSIVWLPLLLEILGNMCIAVFVNLDVTSQILTLIKPSFHVAKIQNKNLNILRTKKAFKVK